IFSLQPVRRVVARRIRAEGARRADPRHYPAPHALLALWVRHGGRGEAAYVAEAESVRQPLAGRTSKNLVRPFLPRERTANPARAARAARSLGTSRRTRRSGLRRRGRIGRPASRRPYVEEPGPPFSAA